MFVFICSGVLEEWDLLRLQPSHSVNVCGGPIWCLQVKPDKSCIAIGCEDGKVNSHTFLKDISVLYLLTFMFWSDVRYIVIYFFPTLSLPHGH